MNSSEMEALRASYRPSRVRVLFVGESPPAAGTFFYAANSYLYWAMEEMLEPVVGASPSFLAAFKKAGCYLDDLVLEPVNSQSPSERTRRRRDNIPMLAERMRNYQPAAVVTVMKGIKKPVRKAYELALLTCPIHEVSFPANGQQNKFRREMMAIIPMLGFKSLGPKRA